MASFVCGYIIHDTVDHLVRKFVSEKFSGKKNAVCHCAVYYF